VASKYDRTEVKTRKRDVFYSDFDINLNTHPASGLLIRKTNEAAVRQSLRALVMTNLGERLYQPTTGGNITATLFEPIDNFTALALEDAIKLTIFNNEPRVAGTNIKVVADPLIDSYTVTINFTVHHSPDVLSTEIVLKRIR